MTARRLATFALIVVATWVALPFPASAEWPEEVRTPRVTSIVAPPPQAVQLFKDQGRALPPFHLLKDPARAPRPQARQGTLNLLAVLVDFSDKTASVTATAAFDNLIFAPQVVGRGSVRDYFMDTSYGSVDITTVNLPSTMGWKRATQTYATYVNNQYGMYGAWPNNAGAMVLDVLSLVDAVVDFSNYDNDGDGSVDTLLIIHAGTGAEFSFMTGDMWAHASSITNMGGSPPTLDGVIVDRYVTVPELLDPSVATATTTDMTIGVICHEVAHGLWGLPDLYDLDVSSYGVGQWALMSYGDWNGPGKYNPYLGYSVTDGSSPALPCAWSRVKMGFDTAYHVRWPQQQCMVPAESLAGGIIRLESWLLGPGEYFLLENRQALGGGYDQYIPGSGVVIWHVDEAQWSVNGGTDNNQECRSPSPHCWGSCSVNHYLVSLEQADGVDDLEYKNNVGDGSDPFPGTSSVTAWRPWTVSVPNPETGSWYDSGCTVGSAIDVTNIFISGLPTLTACVTVMSAGVEIPLFADGFESGDTGAW